MSAFTDKLKDFSRQPVTLAVLTLDWCRWRFGSTLYDSFDDNARDTVLWDLITAGAIPAEQNGKLKFSGLGSNIYYGYLEPATSTGDIDIWIDFDSFAVVGSPSQAAAAIELYYNSSYFARISRHFEGANNKYRLRVKNGAPDTIQYAGSADSSGKIRIKRVGGVVTGYYWSGGAWVQIGAPVGGFTTPAQVRLFGYRFGGTSLSFNFDNFNMSPAPCTATGEPCYNTFPTCKDRPNFSRTSKDIEIVTPGPLPFGAGERPYLKKYDYLPCEITYSDRSGQGKLIENARMKIEAVDEPDTDVGMDPYVTQRASSPNVPGTFWKKLIARNPNYKGRPLKLYEGFYGLTRAEFEEKWVGSLDNITLDGRSGNVKIEAVDLLKGLSKISIPAKLDIKLGADIDASQGTINLTSVAGLDSPSGYVRVKDEVIAYTGISGSQLTGCTRGSLGTIASAAKAKDKVQKCEYFTPQNPFDLLQSILSKAGIAPAYVDSAAFTYWKNWPSLDVNFSALISEPLSAEKLYFEVVELLDCKSWIAEDRKVTIKRNLPNEPGRAYTALTDEANIVLNSGSVDMNDKSRVTRISLYWDKAVAGKDDDPAGYGRLDIALDADAESLNEYNEVAEKKIFCRWLRMSQLPYETEERMTGYITALILRYLRAYRDPQPLIIVSVEIKDSALKTGDFVTLTTDELLKPDGTAVSEKYQVVRREPKGGSVALKLKRVSGRKITVFAPAGTPAWASASDAQREYGFFTKAGGKMTDDVTQGYYFY